MRAWRKVGGIPEAGGEPPPERGMTPAQMRDATPLAEAPEHVRVMVGAWNSHPRNKGRQAKYIRSNGTYYKVAGAFGKIGGMFGLVGGSAPMRAAMRPLASALPGANKGMANPIRSVFKQPTVRDLTHTAPASASPKTNRLSMATHSAPGPTVRTGPGNPAAPAPAMPVTPGVNASPTPVAPPAPKVSSALDPYNPSEALDARSAPGYSQPNGGPMAVNPLLDDALIARALHGASHKVASAPSGGSHDPVKLAYDLAAYAADMLAGGGPTQKAASDHIVGALKEAAAGLGNVGTHETPTAGKQAVPPQSAHRPPVPALHDGRLPTSETPTSGRPVLTPQVRGNAFRGEGGTAQPKQVETLQNAAPTPRPPLLERATTMDPPKRLSDAGRISQYELDMARNREAGAQWGHADNNVAAAPVPAGLFTNLPSMKRASMAPPPPPGGWFRKGAEEGSAADVEEKKKKLKESLREHEKEETPEDEKRESAATQKLERALGTEAHTPDGKKKASYPYRPQPLPTSRYPLG